MEFLSVIALSIIVEGITEYLKLSIDKLQDNKWLVLVITCVLGIGGALAFGADIFALLGIQARVPYVGEVLTGILLARGSNYIYDLSGNWNNGSLVHSYVPCYNKLTNVVGMYDIVGRTFYTNAGTGTFVVGGDVN